MSDPVARPTFYEGEILPAADLIATVDYSRDQMARHDRYLHSWGIAVGLQLQGTPQSDVNGNNYQQVTLKNGIAIDGTGREIVVPDDVVLNVQDFLGEIAPKDQLWYPVFLNGVDQAGQPASNLTGACGGVQPTRTQETYDITFGAPGAELNLDQQQTLGPADPPGDGTENPWRVLLGFVQWGDQAQNFIAVSDRSPDGNGLRYVGVNASSVISDSGALLLATHPAGYAGKNPVMAVQIQEADKDGKLVFGKLNADGSVTPALTVESDGTLTATGKISGAVTPGSTQVQSGLAFDGMTIPLPIGIEPADVAAGKVTVHIQVSLHMDQLTPPASLTSPVAFPADCRVDSTTRQLRSRVQWWDLSGPAPGPILPVFADYMVIVAVPAS